MRYHFIGIKGSGMSALAQIMHDLGNYVQGSDVTHHLFTQDILEEKGITILPFDENNITDDLIVVIGNAFDDSNIEVKKTNELAIKSYRYYELLGELINNYETLAISGCHGKTTTAALLGTVFKDTLGANYLIGDGTGYANNDNKYFFVEACEYKRNFLHYFPKYTIITNIELDHVDYYKDIEDMKRAYEEFADQTSDMIIACGDDVNIRSLKIKKEVIYYGFNENNNVIARNIYLDELGSSFDVYYNEEHLGKFELPLYGKHMILNALSVIIFSYLQGVDMKDVESALKKFESPKRRFKENILKDIITIDDYAHHPTEISVTIDSARQKYKDKEIVAVYFENTYSRTQKLYKDYASALSKADRAYVTDIFSDRELKEDYPNVSPKLILDLLNNGEYLKIGEIQNLTEINNFNPILPLLKHKNSVIIFMGCKEVYYLKEKLENYLENNK